jgi:tRNA (cytidine/uridine-2'-O-)-methyltransferase
VFHLLFHEPEIPPNTGNAIRLVAATGTSLHLVRPLGFDLSDAHLRRAGLDYHDLAHVTVHDDLPAAWEALPDARVFAFSTRGAQLFTEPAYVPGDVLMFGRESSGLPAEVLRDPRVTSIVRIPMLPGLRSLNLSNCAALAVYEAWRQQGFASGV